MLTDKSFNTIAVMLCVVAIVVTVVSVVFAGDRSGPPSRNEIEAQKERCAQPVYVSLGQHTLRIPRRLGDWLFLVHDGKMVRVGCNRTEDSPAKAEHFSFLYYDELPGYPHQHHSLGQTEVVSYQLIFDLLPSNRRDQFTEIIEALNKSGLTLESLPKNGSFYEYNEIGTYYINADGALLSPTGRPLLLYGCPNPNDAFECRAEFLWREDIIVLVNLSTYPSDVSLEAWKDLFPRILNVLESIDRTSNYLPTGDK
ncbi:MAG: hypothetical protein IT557_17360 [Alphaproteobacteria bacterium]|nr:hypothetical protein [Alphaproteobacteria bacterium]